MKITERITDFTKLSAQKKHTFFQEILEFDRQIFPNSTIEELYAYVHDLDACSVAIVHYFLDEQMIGQNIIPILKLEHQGQPLCVITSRAGVLPEYRHKNITLSAAIRIALKHRLRYPAVPLWFITTLMQPKVYSLFASRSQYFYPRHHTVLPDEHHEILRMMEQRQGHAEERGHGIYVQNCLMPKVTPDQLIRLRNRSDQHMQFFMQHVPDYFNGKGIVCIENLNFKSILEVTLNLAVGRTIS